MSGATAAAAAHAASKGWNGSRKIKASPGRSGVTVSRRRVCRIMRENGLAGGIRQEEVQGAPRGGQRGRRAERRRARLRRQGAVHPYMQRLGLRARRGFVELRLPARRPLQRGDRRPLRRTEEGRASSEPSSRITCTGTTTSGSTRRWATCRRSSSGRRGCPSRNRPNKCCQSRPTSRWGSGAGPVAGKGDRQHREPLHRADLQREDQAGLRSPQQAELPRQDLQGHHARLRRLPQGEQGG